MDRWGLVSNIDGTVVRIEGDLDLANSRDLGACLSKLIHSGQRTEIDLSGVEFIDSNGLKALIEAHRRALELDAELVLVAPRGQFGACSSSLAASTSSLSFRGRPTSRIVQRPPTSNTAEGGERPACVARDRRESSPRRG